MFLSTEGLSTVSILQQKVCYKNVSVSLVCSANSAPAELKYLAAHSNSPIHYQIAAH